MNANLPSKISIPEVPGIDDCDHLFVVNSRNGLTTFYARAQEFEWEGKTLYACACTFDCDDRHVCQGWDFPAYAFGLEQVANWLVETARDFFGKGNFCQCSDTKKTRTI